MLRLPATPWGTSSSTPAVKSSLAPASLSSSSEHNRPSGWGQSWLIACLVDTLFLLCLTQPSNQGAKCVGSLVLFLPPPLPPPFSFSCLLVAA